MLNIWAQKESISRLLHSNKKNFTDSRSEQINVSAKSTKTVTHTARALARVLVTTHRQSHHVIIYFRRTSDHIESTQVGCRLHLHIPESFNNTFMQTIN
uniref:Ovule protein n=1 Tax=Ascaris lumbricoides TaxID=6252 RepID=A0A0M3IHV9_ASCLU